MTNKNNDNNYIYVFYLNIFEKITEVLFLWLFKYCIYNCLRNRLYS